VGCVHIWGNVKTLCVFSYGQLLNLCLETFLAYIKILLMRLKYNALVDMSRAVNIDASFNGVLEPYTTYYLTCDLTLSKGFTCSRIQSSGVFFYGNGYIITVDNPRVWVGLFDCDAHVYDLGITTLDKTYNNRPPENGSSFFSQNINGKAENCYNLMDIGAYSSGFFNEPRIGRDGRVVTDPNVYSAIMYRGGYINNCYNAGSCRPGGIGSASGFGGEGNVVTIENSYNAGGIHLSGARLNSDFKNSGGSESWSDTLAMRYLKGAPTQCPGQGRIWTSLTKGEPWILTSRALRLQSPFPLPPPPPTTKIPIVRPPLPLLPASTFAGIEAINKEGGVDISFNYNDSLSYSVDVYTYKRYYYTPSYFDASYNLIQSKLVTDDPKYIKVYCEIEPIDESPIVIRNLPSDETYYFVVYAKSATKEIYHPDTITSSTTENMRNKMEPSQFLSGFSLRYVAGLGFNFPSGSGSIDAYTGTVRDVTPGMKTLFIAINGGSGGQGAKQGGYPGVNDRRPGSNGAGYFIYAGVVFSQVTLKYTTGKIGADGVYTDFQYSDIGARNINDGEDGTLSEIALDDRLGPGIRAEGGGGGWRESFRSRPSPRNGRLITSIDKTFLEIPYSANIWPPLPIKLGGIKGNIFIASSTLNISTFVGSKTYDILAGQTVIVTLFAQAYKRGGQNPIYPGSAIMFLYRFNGNGTLKLTDKDNYSNCSAKIVDAANGDSRLVLVQQNKTGGFSPPVIDDQAGAIKTIWTTIPNNKWYEVIGWNLVNNPDNNKSGYWEFSVWDKSILGNDPPV